MASRDSRQKRKWAALVYIAGDNDLSDSGLQDIQELCDAHAANAGDDGVNSLYVGVEIDTKGEHEGSIRYEITDEGYRTVLERLGERDTGDPRALIEFLRWGFARFPAERYLAVIWGHGEGFKLRRGVALDSTGGSLDIPGVAQALATVGLSSDRKLDVLGFDACLMSMVEVAYCLRKQVKVVVGSQQTEPADGWPYDKVLKAMRSVKTGAELGEKIVDLYIQRCIADRVPNVTQSAIDLGRIDRVMEALGGLGRALQEEEAYRNAVMSARGRAQSFYMADYVDLLDLCNELQDRQNDEGQKALPPSVRQAAQAVTDAAQGAQGAILADLNYGPAVERAHGLSVWFPSDPVLYDRFRSEYRSLEAGICAKCHRGQVLPGQRCGQCQSKNESKPSGLLDWDAFLEWYHGTQTQPESGMTTARPREGAGRDKRSKGRRSGGLRIPPEAPLLAKRARHTPARTGNGGPRR